MTTNFQPYMQGYRATFTIFLGVTPKGNLHIDLAVGTGMTDEPQTTFPRTALALPRLVSHPYRLYPVVDQIADKVCATAADYERRPSSREKDLVDLVVFARTQHINGDALSFAIEMECRRRRLAPLTEFNVPNTWGRGYAKQRKGVPYCDDYPTVELAKDLVSRLVNPALNHQVQSEIWSPDELRWG